MEHSVAVICANCHTVKFIKIHVPVIFCDGSISLFICAVFTPEPLIMLHNITERADTHSDHQQANVSTCWLMKG